MTSPIHTGRLHKVLVLAGLLLATSMTSAQDEDMEVSGDAYPAADDWPLAAPDTSDWGCRNCPPTQGWSGHVEVGAGNVSNDSFEFGNYRGLEEEGGFAVLEGDVLYRGDGGSYFEFRGDELGLDSRSTHVEGGNQGLYRLWLRYDELPHLIADDTRTVFRGTGSSNLTLPAGWVRGDTTADMSALQASLREKDIGQDRESLGLGLDLLATDHWRFDVEAREDTVEGNRILGGTFLFNSTLLPAPVDYETERLDASVSYVRDRWQVSAAFHTSMFTNTNESLTWKNPFTSPDGADSGQLALPPDNQFNQVSLFGSWRSRESLTVSGRVAAGRLEQDERFLPSTTNSSLSVPSLPRNDLDGEVDTLTANVRISGKPADRLTATGEIYYDERDNDTPRDSFVQVATDSIVDGPETNRPFGHERKGGEFTLDYRASTAFTLSGTVGAEELERDFQDSDRTETQTYALEARGRPSPRVGIRVRRLLEQRDSDHDPFEDDPGVTPELRAFHLAERDRNSTEFGVDWLATERVAATLSLELGDDEYTGSKIGLSETDFYSLALDISAAASDTTTTYGFVALEEVEARIDGADNGTGAPWEGSQRDRFWTMGFGLDMAELPGKWKDGSLDLTLAVGEGDFSVDKGQGAPPFPELQTQRITLELSAARALRKDVDLRVGYLVEDLQQDDFFQDDVEPDTIPSVLALGRESRDDTIHVIQVSARYEF